MKLFAVIGPAQQHLWEGRQADRGILWTCWWVKAWSDSFFGTACLMLPLVLSWEVRAGGVLCILDSSKSVYLHLWPCESAWVDQVGRLPSRISLRLGWVCHRGSCFGVGGLKYCLEQQENKWQVLIFHCFSSPNLHFYSRFGKASDSDLAPGGTIWINLPYLCFKNSKIYQFIVILERTVTFLLLLNTLFMLKSVTHVVFWHRWI